jgi:hypothetical protein
MAFDALQASEFFLEFFSAANGQRDGGHDDQNPGAKMTPPPGAPAAE